MLFVSKCFPRSFLVVMFPSTLTGRILSTPVQLTASDTHLHAQKKECCEVLAITARPNQSLFQHSSSLFASFPLIGTCFLSTCTIKIIWLFLTGGERMLEMEEASLEIFAPVPVSTSTLKTVGRGD